MNRGAGAARAFGAGCFTRQKPGRRVLSRERYPVHRLLERVDAHVAEQCWADVRRVDGRKLEQPAREVVVGAARVVERPRARGQRIDAGAGSRVQRVGTTTDRIDPAREPSNVADGVASAREPERARRLSVQSGEERLRGVDCLAERNALHRTGQNAAHGIAARLELVRPFDGRELGRVEHKRLDRVDRSERQQWYVELLPPLRERLHRPWSETALHGARRLGAPRVRSHAIERELPDDDLLLEQRIRKKHDACDARFDEVASKITRVGDGDAAQLERRVGQVDAQSPRRRLPSRGTGSRSPAVSSESRACRTAATPARRPLARTRAQRSRASERSRRASASRR